MNSGIASFTSLGDIVRLSTELKRQLVGGVDSMKLHQFLLLSRTRLAGRKGLFQHWRGLIGYWNPSMELLAEEIGLFCKKDLGPFDFP